MLSTLKKSGVTGFNHRNNLIWPLNILSRQVSSTKQLKLPSVPENGTEQFNSFKINHLKLADLTTSRSQNITLKLDNMILLRSTLSMQENLLKFSKCMSEQINGIKLTKLSADIYLKVNTPCFTYKKQESLKPKAVTRMLRKCIYKRTSLTLLSICTKRLSNTITWSDWLRNSEKICWKTHTNI